MDGRKIFKPILMKFCLKCSQTSWIKFHWRTITYEEANEHEIGVLATLSKKIKFIVSWDMPCCPVDVHRRFGDRHTWT